MLVLLRALTLLNIAAHLVVSELRIKVRASILFTFSLNVSHFRCHFQGQANGVCNILKEDV